MANLYSHFPDDINYGAQKKFNVVDEQKQNLTAMEDQQWNLVAKKLAFDYQMRGVKPDQLSGSLLPSSKQHTLNHNHKPSKAGQNKGMKNSSSKQKHRGFSDAQNDMVNSMIDKLLSLDTKSDIAASQKGILSHTSLASRTNVLNPLQTTSPTSPLDKRFKSLPPAESLPRNEMLGGYIFVCNNDTMQEDLKRQLFGLPQRYRDSVRAIQPGLPLFLYNYTTHQLHGIYEAASFGGSNIDATAWEDKKNKGVSRFPAQVRVRVRKVCKPLEEDAFRPVLFHYDGPKFRLQLSVPETLALMDVLSENH